MSSFVNGCVFIPASSGTGSFVVSAAVTGWQTPAQAGASNGAQYSYRAYSADNTQWEIGVGVYTSGTVTLTRTPTASSNAGSAVNFTVAPSVALTVLATDLTVPTSLSLVNATGLSLTTGVSGTLPATNGGTGTATYATGDILYASATNTLAKLGKGTAMQQLRQNAALTAPEWFTSLQGSHDRLINGNGAINKRGVTAPTDDTYGWDRHNLLTETAAIGISTLSNVANGLPSMMRMTQSQVTAQRMGNSQIIESANCASLRGRTVTLLGKLRNSLAAATRYAILEWTGTADSVISDVVNSWTNGSFTAGQFFISTTLNVLAVGVVTPSAATVTDLLLTATAGSSTNNIIVMIWTETAQAQNSTLDVAWELLDYDATGKTYPTEFRPRQDEEVECLRYFRQINAFTGAAASATVESILVELGVPLRTTAITATWVTNFSGQPGGYTATAIASGSISANRLEWSADITSSGMTTFNAHRWVGGAISLDAEL